MRLTLFGLKVLLFYGAMAGAYLASPYSNVFFLLVSFLTLLWIMGVAWTVRNLASVRAELGELPALPAGAGGSAPVTLSCGLGTHAQVQMVLELEGGERALAEAPVVRREAQADLRVPPLPRGLYPVRKAYLASRYPLGMLERRVPVDAPQELVVYPTPLGLTDARSGGEALADALGTGGGQGELQPSGLRDFRDGDGLRSIHWRASARRGELVVREWEGGGGQGLELLLDQRCEADELEASLSLLSAVVGVARENKEALVLHSQGLNGTFGEGHRPWSELLHFLAGAQTLPASAAAPPPVSPSVPRLPQALQSQRGEELSHAG